MWKTVSVFMLTFFCLGGLVACMNESTGTKTAMVDVQAVIQNGPNAQAAAKHVKESQEIYQYNLNVIEKKLSAYKNKAQARAYLVEAARQLQMQFNTSGALTQQALLQALGKVIEGQKSAYDLIIRKDGILATKEGDGDATTKFAAMPEEITARVQAIFNGTAVAFPPLPKVVENPGLPADLGEGVPFPPTAQTTPEAVEKKETEAPTESKSQDEKAKGKK